jgi:YggT family protein
VDIASILCLAAKAYLVVMFGRVILSWFPIEPGSFIASVYGFLYAITEPVLGPLRRLIPPVGIGGMGLDLSPTIVLFGLFILTGIICP